VISTTHSPLIAGSVESFWDGKQDALFDFDLNGEGKVEFHRREFARHGSAEHWLTSELFDLKSAYPIDAERAINRALDIMERYEFGTNAPASEKTEINEELRRTLGNDDEFWPRWIPWYKDTVN